VTEIDQQRLAPGLTAAIRVFIVDFYRSAAASGARTEVAAPLHM